MFRVTADTLEAYLDFDPDRRSDLIEFHQLMRRTAPNLKRYFHRGTPAGEPGMRMNLIGYGKSIDWPINWPVVGLALQKNYISVYVSVRKAGKPITQPYAGKLGELRMGENNFSFVRFADLNIPALSSLLAEIAAVAVTRPGA